jgi:DNA-binding HxlR family transcriptional regulator
MMDLGRRRPLLAPHDVAIAILEKKWTGHIVVLLRHGPQRFSELYQQIPFVSHKVLTEQLRALERDGVLERREMSGGPRQVLYELTAAGKELLPIMDALGQWGRNHAGAMGGDANGGVSPMTRRRSGETQALRLPAGNGPTGHELAGA